MSDDQRRHFQLETTDGITVVRFLEAKIVTEEDIQQIGDELNSLVDQGGHHRLLLDFERVQYLSSAALGKLINLKKRVAAVDGVLKLCSVHPDLFEVFRLTRLDTVFDIFKDEKTALAAF